MKNKYILTDFHHGVWIAEPQEGYDRRLKYMHPDYIVGRKAYAGMEVLIDWVPGRGLVAVPSEV